MKDKSIKKNCSKGGYVDNRKKCASNLSDLQRKFKGKLEGGRFRYING